jgi:hypothetical protein
MKLKITLIVFCLCLCTCQKDNKATLEYTYATDTSILDCGTTNTKLFEEALLSFENDIVAFYKPFNGQVGNAYKQFITATTNRRATYNDIISDHSKAVFEALKTDKSLWKEGQQGKAYNYSHPIFSCISEHITDEKLGTTYRALLSTNSMSPRMLEYEIQRRVFSLSTDKFFATHVALDLFYGKLHEVDFTKPKADLSGEIIDQKNNPKTEKDPHAGHNH